MSIQRLDVKDVKRAEKIPEVVHSWKITYVKIGFLKFSKIANDNFLLTWGHFSPNFFISLYRFLKLILNYCKRDFQEIILLQDLHIQF